MHPNCPASFGFIRLFMFLATFPWPPDKKLQVNEPIIILKRNYIYIAYFLADILKQIKSFLNVALRMILLDK